MRWQTATSTETQKKHRPNTRKKNSTSQQPKAKKKFEQNQQKQHIAATKNKKNSTKFFLTTNTKKQHIATQNTSQHSQEVKKKFEKLNGRPNRQHERPLAANAPPPRFSRLIWDRDPNISQRPGKKATATATTSGGRDRTCSL